VYGAFLLVALPRESRKHGEHGEKPEGTEKGMKSKNGITRRIERAVHA
jgi:hypothetical protein